MPWQIAKILSWSFYIIIHKLREEFIVGMHYEHLVVEGDGKLYEIICNLNMEKN